MTVKVCGAVAECPLLVVTGPTSLVSSSSLTRKRVSDTEQRSQRHHDDDGHLASPEMTSRDDTEGGALSDGEVDRCATTNHRIIRNRFTSQVGHDVVLPVVTIQVCC